VVFRKDILEIIKGLVQREKSSIRFSIFIIVSMIPAAFIGLFFNDIIEILFNKNVVLVGSMLLVTGVLLLITDFIKIKEKELGIFQVIVIGIAQAIAILPGISRSGATISTAVILGISRTEAAKFSFLMVVPLILGKMAKDLMDAKLVMESDSILPLGLGFIAAFITGLLACTWMIRLVKSSKLWYFAIYCFVVGISALIINLI
jgi:undecaprenyl-diphosphatase